MEKERVDRKDDQAQPIADPQPVSEAEQALGARVTALEAAVLEKEAALSEARKTLDARAADYTSLKTSYDEAVKSYRRLAVGSNPIFSEELIAGDTIAEIDSALTRAADFVGKVRSKIEEDLKNLSIPAGAPERSGPDTSGYSPREKIAEGIKKQHK
jgi:ABC-type transporter Mla subunit MlaD